jgi:hypothetical protein
MSETPTPDAPPTDARPSAEARGAQGIQPAALAALTHLVQASAEALANAAHNATQAQQSAHQVLLATSTQAAALLLQAGRPAEVSDV